MANRRTIYLLRHAKSSWKDAELSDIDRPLNKRGKENAPLMGKRLKKLEAKPDLIISSPAKRALKTAQIIADEIGYQEKNIHIDMELYGANVEEIFSLIEGLGDNLKSVMLVGHNPGLTLSVPFLCGEPLENVPTCGVVRIDFAVKSWSMIEPGKGKFVFFEYPKMFTFKGD